ncbi:MAG: DJ-1/PfpI family protein [Planctomycetaceae bacterium]|nr:DJ-1/PfpI family protein [Planctomycetaceae bacterium]
MASRREFITAAVAAAVSGTAIHAWSEEQEPSQNLHAELMAGAMGNEQVALLVYDGFTPLDLFGPHHLLMLMGGAECCFVAATSDLVTAEGGMKIVPTMTFADCPEKLSVLLVPGGSQGALEAMKDKQTRDFVASRGAQAEWVASVCTGSLILGAAGLLDGYKATSHWLVRDVLADLGATPVNERVVIDRNRITAAGVTAGIDLGLTLVGKYRGDSYAQAAQLFAEYDPQPPYDSGSCEKAPQEIVEILRTMHSPFADNAKEIAQDIARQAAAEAK